MTNAEARIVHLEQELRRDELAIAALQAAVAALQQAVRTAQTSPYGGGSGGGGTFEIVAANAGVIAAGGNSTGVTMSQRVGSTVVTVSTTATVYNDMEAPTVASKTIICGQNSDGSFLVITQSC
jgi:hypothetical protein